MLLVVENDDLVEGDLAFFQGRLGAHEQALVCEQRQRVGWIVAALGPVHLRVSDCGGCGGCGSEIRLGESIVCVAGNVRWGEGERGVVERLQACLDDGML